MKFEAEKNNTPDAANNLGGSLMASVSKSGASDIAAEAAEIAFDSALDGGLLEEVPVFGWLMKSYNVVGAIRERIFLKKVASFLAGTSNVSESERAKFQEDIQADPNFSRKVGEGLVLLLDRQEDFDKAIILGKVFSRYMRGHIQYEQFVKMAKSIELAYIGDLRCLAESYKKIKSYNPELGKPFSDLLDDHTIQSLYSSGLVRSEGYTESIYYPNNVGEEILQSLSE
ncbi:MAG: hypothetical protein U0998_06095 [Moraxellaceae bacterium]|nr:hypothetical protein [Moraxellaceae bacterium]MDZ4386774.1 hypothetical protein [Moraxellaceae bacterium]